MATRASVACENIRFSSLFVAEDVSRGGTFRFALILVKETACHLPILLNSTQNITKRNKQLKLSGNEHRKDLSCLNFGP